MRSSAGGPEMGAEAVARGTCFGFQITSSLPLRYLRSGGGETLKIEIGEQGPPPGADDKAVLHWTPPAAPLDARLFGDESAYRLWIERSGWFDIDIPHGRITVPGSDEPIRREERLWGIPSVLAFAARGDVPL